MQIRQSTPSIALGENARPNAAEASAPQRAVRFAQADAAGSQDSFASSLPWRSRHNLRRYGQNAKGFAALGLTCCLMPCMGRRPGL